MPGIYVNDGGATSSAIGNILGGIAQEVGPEGRRRPRCCRNRRKALTSTIRTTWNKLMSDQNLDIPGLTRTLNMNATDPGNPSVAGTVTSLAQPPDVRGPGGRLATIPDESGYTPEQKYLAQRGAAWGAWGRRRCKDVD